MWEWVLENSIFIVISGCYLFLFSEFYYRKAIQSKVSIRDGQLIERYVILEQLKKERYEKAKYFNGRIGLSE